MTIHSTTFALPTIQATRARNRAEQHRRYAISNVMDRLEVYAAFVLHPTDATDAEVRRRTATDMVDAVIAELRGGSCE